MGKNKKKNGLGLATLVALVGMTIGRSVNPKVQLLMLLVASIYLIISFSISLSKKRRDESNYIYIGALGITSLYSLYLISKFYLGWDKGIQELLILITFIPIAYLVGMSIYSKLISGDRKQIEFAKRGIFFLGVIIFAILLIVIAYYMK